MKTSLAILMLIGLCGCSSVSRHKAVQDAVTSGRISGIAPTDCFVTIPWTFPSKFMGPYSEIAGFSGTRTNAPSQPQDFAFFVGKRRTTKQWEVFSALMLTNGLWQTLRVDLPNK